MIPSNFEYKKANSVDEAIGLLDGNSKILAGGHSLIPALKLRFDNPGTLVDISGLDQLRYINDTGDHIAVGAASTHYEIASSEAIRNSLSVLSEAASIIGDLAVRNKGTIGGSLAHADPAADYPGVTLACNATIVVKGKNGERLIPATDFFKGFFTTDLQDGEIITEIRFPKGDHTGSAYRKFEQPASRYAIVGCAVTLKHNNGTCESISLGVNGLTNHAIRATATEQHLAGKELSDQNIGDAVALIANGVEPSSDHFASGEYRTHLAGVYASRAIKAAMG